MNNKKNLNQCNHWKVLCWIRKTLISFFLLWILSSKGLIVLESAAIIKKQMCLIHRTYVVFTKKPQNFLKNYFESSDENVSFHEGPMLCYYRCMSFNQFIILCIGFIFKTWYLVIMFNKTRLSGKIVGFFKLLRNSFKILRK